MGPSWRTRLDLDPQSASEWHTQRCLNSSKPLLKEQGVGGGPNPGNLCLFPKIVGKILPLVSMWNYPAYKNYPGQISGLYSPSAMACTVCVVCFSLYLNKSTSYLSLCLSEFFLRWDIKNLSFIRSWNQVPWVLAGFESQPCGFGSLWLGSSPGTWVQVPICGKWFQQHQPTSPPTMR